MPDTQQGSHVPVKYVDNGDGTYSLSVAGGVIVAGGPATIADGADVAEGAKANAAVTDPTASASVISLLKGLLSSVSAYRYVDLGVTGRVVKANPGTLYSLHATNAAVAARYVKVYNKSTAPTQADTPIFTFAVPASSSFTFNVLPGVGFAAGISLRATTGIADADVGAPDANDVVVSAAYR